MISDFAKSITNPLITTNFQRGWTLMSGNVSYISAASHINGERNLSEKPCIDSSDCENANFSEKKIGLCIYSYFGPITRTIVSAQDIGGGGSGSLTICLVHSGVLEWRHEGRSLRGLPGDVCLFGYPLPLTFESGALVASVLAVPASTFDSHAAGLLATGRILREDHPLKRMLFDYMMSLSANFNRLTDCEAVLAIDITLTLLRSCESLFIAQYEDDHPKRSAIRRYVEENLADRNLGARDLATRFALSRASLYRIFDPLGGVAEYIRKRRLARVRAEIMDPMNHHRRIADLAYDWGFDNSATFSTLFKRTYGVSPRHLRQARNSSRMPSAEYGEDELT